MSRSKRRHGDFYKFILLALQKEDPLSRSELERWISQFDIGGVKFVTRLVASVFAKFGHPAAIRSSKSRRDDETEVDIEVECLHCDHRHYRGAVVDAGGIRILDALIGGFIAVRILVDSIDLSRETFSSMKGEKVALEKYGLPLEKQWQRSKLETYRTWILFAIKEKNLNTKDALIAELDQTFKPKYIPILSEFKFNLAEDIKFEESFDTLITPLLEAVDDQERYVQSYRERS